MSLISCIRNHGHPIIVSDLVLSTAEDISPVVIPLRNQVYSKEDFSQISRPYSYALKTLIIKSKLCVGIAGIVWIIKELFDSVLDFFLHREVTEENLNILFTNLQKEEKFCDTSAVFIFILPDEHPNLFLEFKLGNWKSVSNSLYDEMYSAGTGAEDWSKKFTEISTTTNISNTVLVYETILRVLLSCIYFLDEERITPENLQNCWGGGFDIIVYKDRYFSKLNKVSYVFWEVDISQEDWQVKLNSFIRFSYINENLFIQYFDNANNKTFGISQLNSKVCIERYPDKLDYSSNIVTSCIYVKRSEVLKTKLYSIYLEPDENKQLITAIDKDGHLAIGINIEVEKSIRETIENL